MKNNPKHPLKAMAYASVVAFQLVSCLLMGVFGGKWIDSKLNTDPLFLIVCLFLGIFLGVMGLFYILKDKIQGD
mgnify:FL=1